MKPYGFVIPILFALFSYALNVPSGFSKEFEKQKDLKEEIHTLNLINGLYLDKEQMEFILDKARQAKQIRDESKQNIEELSEEDEQTLGLLRKELIDYNGAIADDITKKTNMMTRRLEMIQEGYNKRIEVVAKELKENLSETQLYLIDEFKPCLIPPKGPAKIGQAENSEAGAKKLEQIRNMPKERYDTLKKSLANEFLFKAKKHSPKGLIVDEDTQRKKIIAVFDEARTLSDTDFSLKKGELAKNLKIDLLPKKVPIDITVKIERYLLNPAVIPVLEEKLALKEKE